MTVAFGAGWLVGGSGRSASELAAGRAAERADFLEAGLRVQNGHLSLLQSSFRDAGLEFAAARGVIEQLQTRLRETGQAERAGHLEVALAHLREAVEGADAYDPDARNAAEAALRALATVGGG